MSPAQSVAPGFIGTSSIGSKTRGTRSSSKKFLDNPAEKVRAFAVELNLAFLSPRPLTSLLPK